MREEIIVSGRLNEGVDPILSLWHWPIPVYLFLGGLAAGILFFAALFTINGKADKYAAAVKTAPIFVPLMLVLGLGALFFDLRHKMYFWQLYTVIRFESPMSWGAWTLLIITPISLLWAIDGLKELKPEWTKVHERLKPVNIFFRKHINAIAWITAVLAVILGVYTGILLSAFNARPLWNTSLLGPLFLVSGLSTGAAFIMLITKNHTEKKFFGRIDLLLITIELFFIIHLFMGFLAGSEVQIEAAQLFLGGSYSVSFWVFVVGMGLLIPAIFEVMEFFNISVPVFVPTVLILLGGLIFRFIMVEAGQITRYLY